MQKILFVGSLTSDEIFYVDDFGSHAGKYMPERVCYETSGMAANAAVAATKLGGDTALVASIGDDSKGNKLKRDLFSDGVDVTYVTKVQATPTNRALVIVNHVGDRWVIIAPNQHSQSPLKLNIETVVAGSSVIMADVRWPIAADLLLHEARRQGKPAVLDLDVGDLSELKPLASLATHLIASAKGAMILTSTSNPRDAAIKLNNTYDAFVCVTDGENGCYWFEDVLSEPIQTLPPRLRVTDTNGAGDIFHGAFVLAMAKGWEYLNCIQFASTAAAMSCTVSKGRHSAPDLSSVLKLMNDTY